MSGELTGTTTEVGPFPVVFTAFDQVTGETLSLATEFPVLPAGGGDTNGLATNFWVKKQIYNPAKGTWKALYLYNEDRSTGMAFDPATEEFDVSLGSRTISLAPGNLISSKGRFSFKTPKGVTPAVAVLVDPSKQRILLKIGNDTLTDTVPGNLVNSAFIGNRGYKLSEFHNEKGKFKAALGFRNTAFVVEKGKAKVIGGGSDKLNLALLLADPAFSYTAGVSTLRFRLLSQGVVLIDRDFTALGTSKESIDSTTGVTVFSLTTAKDASPVDTVKFNYKSKTGKMKLVMQNVALSLLPASEAHVMLELTVDDRTYLTSVTLFESRTGSFSTKQ